MCPSVWGVCAACVPVMDDGAVGCGSSIHTAAPPPLRRDRGDGAGWRWVLQLFVCTAGPLGDGADQPHQAAYY